jgi:hypothetical protein
VFINPGGYYVFNIIGVCKDHIGIYLLPSSFKIDDSIDSYHPFQYSGFGGDLIHYSVVARNTGSYAVADTPVFTDKQFREKMASLKDAYLREDIGYESSPLGLDVTNLWVKYGFDLGDGSPVYPRDNPTKRSKNGFIERSILREGVHNRGLLDTKFNNPKFSQFNLAGIRSDIDHFKNFEYLVGPNPIFKHKEAHREDYRNYNVVRPHYRHPETCLGSWFFTHEDTGSPIRKISYYHTLANRKKDLPR